MPFNFSQHMHALMADIAATCAELRHVDMTRVGVAFAQARNARLHGFFARVHPLRFPGGATRVRRGGATYAMPRVVIGGVEVLYVVEFFLPRFMCIPFGEKLSTVVHEMYHVSPAFDGTLRRFAGSKPYHTGSQRRYDAAMARLARAYLGATKRPELHAFLRSDFAQLEAAHGGVVGVRVRRLGPRRIA